jgi:hypothetical protein
MRFFAFVAHAHVRHAALCALTTLGLAACGGDQGSTGATPSDPSTPVTTPVSPPTVSVNTPPTISGEPVTAVNVGAAYSFTPTASDANGDALTFGIQNKPVWSTFDTASGVMKGTPAAADAGTYANVIISVSDGKASVSLAAFTLTINQISNGTATLNWMPPTQNTDGTALMDLAGFRVHYGTTAGNLTQSVTVANAGLASYTISNLSSGTWYFSISAYTKTGVESDLSDTVSTTFT